MCGGGGNRTRDSLWVSEEGERRGLKILHETSGQKGGEGGGGGEAGVENRTRDSGIGRLNKSWVWGVGAECPELSDGGRGAGQGRGRYVTSP